MKKKSLMKKIILMSTCVLLSFNTISAKAYTADLGNGYAQNPVIYADYPDNCVIKVDSTYYMISSNISYMPGLPILKSEDLVNWEICSYAIDRIDTGMSGIDQTHADAYNMKNGKNVYANGVWAPSLKYNNGTFYATFSSLDLGKTFVCTKKAPMGMGGWTFNEISGLGYSHDGDLFFDTDGRVYLVSGSCTVTELNSDCKSVKRGGINQKVFDGGNTHDGNRIFKRNGYYYILSTPVKEYGPYQRIEKAWRSRNLTGPYEQTTILDDGGNHQVCIVEDGSYNWAVLFEDKGAVGRIPKVTPVKWVNDWPKLGTDGDGKIPSQFKKPVSNSNIKSMLTTDEFNTNSMNSQWQWNHNPDNSKWSKSDRAGWLRLKTNYAANLTEARNTLTQRIQGPTSCGYVKLDASNLKPGQIAGLSAFHCKYGYIGVKNDNGTKKLVQYNVNGSEKSMNLNNNTVYLKVDADCNSQVASFYYSYDGKAWTKMGDNLQMDFYYKLWFVGYRFGLFNYTTGSDTSGYADFDYFKFSQSASGTNMPKVELDLNDTSSPDIDVPEDKPSTDIPQDKPNNPGGSTDINPGTDSSLNNGWYYIKNVHAQKYLTVKDNDGKAGQNVELVQGLGIQGQKWYLNNMGNGYFTLKSALGEFMLDVANGESKDGANLGIYHAYSGDAQQFTLKSPKDLRTFVIATKVSNGGSCLDDYDFKTDNGTNVCQWQCTGNDNQQWIFESIN